MIHLFSILCERKSRALEKKKKNIKKQKNKSKIDRSVVNKKSFCLKRNLSAFLWVTRSLDFARFLGILDCFFQTEPKRKVKKS